MIEKRGGVSFEGINFCKWMDLTELFGRLEKGVWEELGTVIMHRKSSSRTCDFKFCDYIQSAHKQYLNSLPNLGDY